jgi:imidazole glycerol-phosphate synthase subunit HisH
MRVVLIEYNAGNYKSVTCALHRLGVDPLITSDPELIKSADKVIFPGVGEARSTMKHLRSRGLDKIIYSLTQPVLGICLGMQLLCEWSEENDTECLGIFPNRVKKFRKQSKVPHMGWNLLKEAKGPLFDEMPQEFYCYFVHSYYAELNELACGVTEYGEHFAAVLSKDNFTAVQFHPEKSGDEGQRLLRNFLRL